MVHECEPQPLQACSRRSNSTGSAATQPRLAPPAHSMNQVAWSARSACQARTHAAQMQVTAVRQLQYACTSRAVVVAHGAAACHSVHPRGQPSIPRPRGTSDATAQQRVGRLPPNFQKTQSRSRALAAVRSARPSLPCHRGIWSLVFPPLMAGHPRTR